MKTNAEKLVVYTIAGSDNSGGAGIQADLATFADFGVHGCSVITALTAQSRQGVRRVAPTPIEHLEEDFQVLWQDMPPRAIKLGMLVNAEITAKVAALLSGFPGPIVYDPVMSATSGGSSLWEARTVDRLLELLPQLTLITPNVAEAAKLCGIRIRTFAEMEVAASILLRKGAQAVLVTGGDLPDATSTGTNGYCFDYFASATQAHWLRGERVATGHNHGTGCTLSSAITAVLALGYELADAVVLGKMAVTQGLRAARPIAGTHSSGRGCVAHAGWPAGLENLPAILPCRPDLFKPPTFTPSATTRLGLYPVVDSVDWLEKLMAEGVKTVQLRIKNKSEAELREHIQQAVVLQKRYDAQLFINDYWPLAIEYGAYGVHLGQEDMDTADFHAIARAGLRLGLSNHSWYEIARSHALTPSYIALGPIYHTTTKDMRFAPQGLEQLQQWVDLLEPGYPLIAIGGIDESRAPQVAATGVGSIAVVRAITESADYSRAVKNLTEAISIYQPVLLQETVP